MKSFLGEQDLVKVYLSQMSDIPPISVEEERELAGDLEAKRNALTARIFFGGLPLVRAHELLLQVRSGEVPVDRVFLVDVNDKALEAELRGAIEETLPELETLVRLVRRDFRAYLTAQETQERRLKLRKTVRGRLEEGARLLSRFSFQVPRLVPIVAEVKNGLRRMKAARRRYGSLEAQGAARDQLDQATAVFVEAQLDALATPKTIRRYVEDVEAAREAYDEAKRRLSSKNLRLVVSIAKRFRTKGLPFLDLIQEGNTGLLKALDRYQGSRGNKFSTYATWWIKQTITRSIAYQARTVRIPIHAINSMNRLLEDREAFLKREGREPTTDEIANLAKLPPKEVGRLFDLNRASLSLDQPQGTSEEGLFAEGIEDPRTEGPVEASQRSQLREHIRKLLKQLSYREREVLKLRYGLDNSNTYTLEEVGQIFRVSRERIRQIEVGAVQKLKLPVCREKLQAFWEEIHGG